MGKGYRGLVAVMSAMMILCTAAMAFAEIRLFCRPDAHPNEENRSIVWYNDHYRIRASIEEGALEELHIQRLVHSE